MPGHHSQQGFNLSQAIKKFSLSLFVVFAFIAYVIHERLTNPGASLAAARRDSSSPMASSAVPTDTSQTLTNPTRGSQGSYKDGTYKGSEIDAYYGLVQVQATIQSGKIANVQFIEYPSDRRTSVEINNIAVPYLQQEAMQAQSARVDIISGATLTSEAFIMSLQNALNSAKN